MTTKSFGPALTASGKFLTLFFLLIISLLAAIPAQAQTSNSWAMGTPMPTARQGPFSGIIGSKIYVVGGVTNTSVVNVNEIYDTTTDSWSTGAPMPTPRWLAASAVVGNILYTIGGRSSSNISLNVVEAYDPSTNTWSAKAPMPVANDNIYATVENNVIYVIGGFSQSSQQRLTTVQSYNPASNVWKTLAPLNVGKSESAVGLLGSTIISAGGLTNSGATTKDTEGYNATTNSWTTLAPLPTARQAGCFGVAAGLFYFAGGTAGSPLNILEAYDATANAWTSGLPSMPNAVVSPGSATDGGRLYCFGGSNNGGGNQGTVNNYVQIYQPAVRISITSVQSLTAYGASPSIAPGSWIEIHGTQLATGSRAWNNADFNGPNAPTSLDGTSVSIGGQAAYIASISPGQIDAQVPSVGVGSQQIVVTTAQGNSNSYPVTVNGTQPGLLAPPSLSLGGNQYVLARFANTLAPVFIPGDIATALSARPVPGDTITFYGIGFGPVTPDSPPGQIVQQDNTLVAPLQVFLGGAPATVVSAGLVTGNIGLYQITITFPDVAASDAVPLTFTLGGASGSQTLYTAVGN